MKNKKMWIIAGLSVILLSGCGSSKTLKCTFDRNNQMMGMGSVKEILEFKYDSKGETLESAKVGFTVEVNEEDYASLMKNQLETQCKTIKEDDESTECNVTIDGKKISLLAEMDKKALENNGLLESKGEKSLESNKKYLVGEGYTCE